MTATHGTSEDLVIRSAGTSIMSRRVRLTDLIDTDSFREVMQSFTELYGLGIKVFDAQGQKVVDYRAQTAEYCALMFTHYETKVRCTNLVSQVKGCELDSPHAQAMHCFSGLQYRVAPLQLEGDYLGRIVYGPFRPDQLLKAPVALGELAPDMIQADEVLVQIRPIAERAVDQVVKHCQSVVDALIFAGYKALVSSQMHIESITAAYADLEEKNRTLTDANDKLREMDKVKSNFIATVSHELRTPLTSVIGYSEMLLEGLAGPLQKEQREYIETIMEKGESLLQLITSILDLSKIESGQFSLNRKPTDAAAVVKSALSDVTPQARKKNISVVSNVPQATGQKFLLDEDKLHRSITNLLSNAVKFTPDNGKVELTLGRYDGKLPDASGRPFDIFMPENNQYLLVKVKDTGIGVPADKLKRVFDPFFQVDSSSTREYGGTGLGLAIVKNFVEAHGGTVWVESAIGQGSTFFIALPWSSLVYP